jgi:hypothetical protein
MSDMKVGQVARPRVELRTVELKSNLRSLLCPPSSRGTRSVADKQRNAGGCGVQQSNRSSTYVRHFVPLHQGGRVPLPACNGTQGVMLFSSRIEVRPTFITLSPFLKGDAFRCRQATERRGSWCSAVELKSVLQQQSTNFQGREESPPPVFPSASPPSASTLCVRRTGGTASPLIPLRDGDKKSTPLGLCRTCRSGSLQDREKNRKPWN